MVLVVGHPVGAFTEAAEVGREHDVTHSPRAGARSRRPRPPPARGRTASPCPVRGRGSRARPVPARVRASCGTSRYAGTDMVRFGVEDDAVAAVRAAVDRLGDLDVERHRARVGVRAASSTRVACASATRRTSAGSSTGHGSTRRRFRGCRRQYAQLEKLRAPRHASQRPTEAARRDGCRYGGRSPTPTGSGRGSVENTRPVAFGEAPRERIAERRRRARRLPSGRARRRARAGAPARRGADRGIGTPRRASSTRRRDARTRDARVAARRPRRSASTGGRRTARRRARRTRPSCSTSRSPSGSTRPRADRIERRRGSRARCSPPTVSRRS